MKENHLTKRKILLKFILKILFLRNLKKGNVKNQNDFRRENFFTKIRYITIGRINYNDKK